MVINVSWYIQAQAVKKITSTITYCSQIPNTSHGNDKVKPESHLIPLNTKQKTFDKLYEWKIKRKIGNNKTKCKGTKQSGKKEIHTNKKL